MTSFTIQPMTADHADDVLRIYGEGIATGHATFEATPPSWAEFDSARLSRPRLVAIADKGIVGWAMLSAVSSRPVYRGVAEVAVYVADRARERGIGRALLSALITAAEQEGIWTLQASIFPENEASLRLHWTLGFREVGIRRRIGRMAHGPWRGRWRDTVLLEWRSEIVGTT